MTFTLFRSDGTATEHAWDYREIKPWLVEVTIPIPTKAPGPSRCTPYCCYISTVIFYHRPYIVEPAINGAVRWYVQTGKVSLPKPDSVGSFVQYDQVDCDLSWFTVVRWRGDIWEMSNGKVVWLGRRKRWCFIKTLRRIRAEDHRGNELNERAYAHARRTAA